MKIFDLDVEKPNYLTRHKKVHGILAVLLSLVIAPILSAAIIAGSGANLVTTSISKIGWQNDWLVAVYFWGLYNLALFFYLLKLVLDEGQYDKKLKIAFYAVTAVSCVILLVGISIPFINDEIPTHMLMRKIHNGFATTGFVLFVVVLIALTVTTLFRNKTQALISAGLLAFLIISGLFAVLCVNSPEHATFITASAQMYIFSMLHILLACQFFLNSVLPNEKCSVQSQRQ
ncbi:MAG: hypothetical protein NC037_03075 [Bacteroides sp.]|nr:hypothetical protein [Bacillota bacterium]MCM1394043.1 hypothetical protein [[Eubacterium] siraeum]MCM1455495.1 hypothetical protein [Bacteroides sp.]